MLYAYHTATHISTGSYITTYPDVWQPHSAVFKAPCGFEPMPYKFHIHDKLAKLRDFVKSQLVISSASQKMLYNYRSQLCSFNVNDNICLSISMAGKLDPKWEDNWKITSLKSPITIDISDGKCYKVVHMN